MNCADFNGHLRAMDGRHRLTAAQKNFSRLRHHIAAMEKNAKLPKKGRLCVGGRTDKLTMQRRAD